MSRSISDRLISELEAEAQSTRRLFERIPQEHLAWRPHERSLSVGQLALHIAGVPMGIARLLTPLKASIPEVPYPQPTSTEEVMRLLDRSIDEARERLRTWSDPDYDDMWSLSSGDQVLIESPRYEMARALLFNHVYHHRGQLTVYLRMLDVRIPGMYGPTADE